jgi:hypothetical protein
MKKTRSNVFLPMAAMILAAALADPAAAQTSCAGFAPGCFKGTFQGEDATDTLARGVRRFSFPPIASLSPSSSFCRTADSRA